MSVKSDIRDGIVTIVKQAMGDGGSTTFSAEVLTVDVSTRTCKVASLSSDVSMEFDGVQLMPEVEDGLLYTPVIGSTVIVSRNANLQPYVSMWSAIEAVYYVAGGSTLKIDKTGLQLDGKAFFGIPKVAELVKQYNLIEQDLNTLKGLLATAVGAIVAAGAVPTTPVLAGVLASYFSPLTPYTAQLLKPTLQIQIENPKVQHGDGSL